MIVNRLSLMSEEESSIFCSVCRFSDGSSVTHRNVASSTPGVASSPSRDASMTPVAMTVLPAPVGAASTTADRSLGSSSWSRVARMRCLESAATAASW
jgi:hypothetical protein